MVISYGPEWRVSLGIDPLAVLTSENGRSLTGVLVVKFVIVIHLALNSSSGD